MNDPNHIAADSALLLAVLRSVLNAAPFPAVSESDGQWTRLLRLAEAHSVVPLLIAALPPGAAPGSVTSALKHAAAHLAHRDFPLLAQLLQISAHLQKHGIPAVPFKGPVLAAAAYKDLSHRTFADLDFLVRPADVLRTRDILLADGFVLASHIHWNVDSAYLRSPNSEFNLWRGPTAVDLHWRILPTHFPFNLDSDSLWADLGTISIAGRQLPAFSNEHQLLYLAAHGAKHYWSKWKWVCDFARFVQNVPIDWPHAITLCRQAGSIRILTHALELIRVTFAVEMPAAVLPHLDPTALAMAQTVQTHLLTNNGERPGVIANAHFMNGFIQTIPDALRLLHGVAIAPTEAEWALLKLPPALYPLYYPFRLGRIAVKHSFGRLFR